MTVFVEKLNLLTGVNDLVVQQEDFDYHQDVARASFADMLHDADRNIKYELALKAAIELMHKRGKKANVLDIGTGTGLLSMMAVKHGADLVIACEAFKPMSECALKVIERNGFKDKIRLIPKKSSEILVGKNCDMEHRCNILVTEVFDTELIGEGALSTFRHAHKYLLEEDCIVVPQSATIYAQVAECPYVQNWNKIKDIYDDDGKLLVEVPTSIKDCPGTAAVHDLQLSQLKPECIKTIASAIPVFCFDWSGKAPLIFEDSSINTIKAESTGSAQVVFMWWDLQMDTENKITLSCAPTWAFPHHKNTSIQLPWRDHWMQAVYYLPTEVKVKESQEIHLLSCHDEFSLWFNLKVDLKIVETDYIKPLCECGLHIAYSRTRIGQMNDFTRNKKYLKLLEKHITHDSVLLVLSEGFCLSLAAAKMGAKQIYYIEKNPLSHRILLDFIKTNKIENVTIFDSLETLRKMEDIKTINLVFGEPFFLNNILPWDNLQFLYHLKDIKSLVANNAQIFPKVAKIKAVAMHFTDLHKIRLPIGTCEGFIMKDFDDLIEASSNISDDHVEAQPLWEYPGVAVSKIVDLITIDCANIPDNTLEAKGVIEIAQSYGNCNGVAIWMEWTYKDVESVISSGPTTSIEIGQFVEWYVHTRQAVCLLNKQNDSKVSYEMKFDLLQGNIKFICT